MFESEKKLAKINVEIEVHLDDGSQFLGMVSVKQDQRVSELMNDERQYLPIQMPKGNVVILRKTVIIKVVPLDQHIEHDKIKDPYQILGVPRGLSDDDLRQSYRKAVKENHPDKIKGAGLSPQHLDMATSRLVRINDAYERIVSMRLAAVANDQKCDVDPAHFH